MHAFAFAYTRSQIMATSSIAFVRVPALVLMACACVAQASPRPPLYHAAAVQPEWHDTFLYAVNENGVAAGEWGSAVGQGAVWQDGALRALDCQRDDSPYSNAYDINDAMQVAGYCYRSGVDYGYYAVLWDAAGNPTPIRDGAIEPQFARALNNSGQVVGTLDHVGYVWKAGKLKSLGTLGGSTSSPEAINDKGWIVGSSTVADGSAHAFVYRQGHMEDLNWPYTLSYAEGVNSHGHIAGWSGESIYSSHAILDNGTTITDLGRHTSALGINDFDQVVGTMTVNGGGHAFIYTHGHLYDLNTLLDSTSDPGWQIDVAYDINDSGVIVGWGNLGCCYQPVVLTPVP
jgi:probable HAF family extracellular repeat protein